MEERDYEQIINQLYAELKPFIDHMMTVLPFKYSDHDLNSIYMLLNKVSSQLGLFKITGRDFPEFCVNRFFDIMITFHKGISCLIKSITQIYQPCANL